MQCPACGHTNRPNARFCGACAAPLTSAIVPCRSCGTENPGDQRFCDACGQILGTGPVRSASPTPAPAPAPPTSFANGRYELLRFLGEGGRKRVYLADDKLLGREVAVAVVKTDGLEESGFARVRREAEAMGRLGDHPNIVTVYDIGEEPATPHGSPGGLFIVGQYMPGGDLERLLDQAPDHRLSVEEVIRIGRDVACALAHAHAHEVIHRDLKPQNVWLTQDGTAKLGDFGLAVALDRSRLTVEGTMVGTVAYMPPEQALGRPADGRSDIYALGALLYELLCGRPPYVGEDAVAIISQHIHTAPVGPSWHRPDVPRALEELVLQMLAKGPDDRPQTADDVVATLDAIAAVAASAETATPQETAALDRLSDGAFVGRERETRELREGLDQAMAGHGHLFMVAGESGIGKTRLATELATYASLRGVQVLWGRCYEGEGAPAYWPWVQVIRAHVHERDATALSSEMGPGAADIAQVVSEVRDRLPGLPPPPPLEPEQARFRLFDAISTFLRNASARQPLAIVLDDLHSADKPSLLLLQFLAREVKDARILVLGTYRDVELDRRHPLAEVLSTLRHERGYERVLLRGLQGDEVKRMIEAAAQHELETPEEVALVDAVHRETEGNPFFIEEVIRHLVETGGVYRREGRWVSNARRIEELGIPEGVRDVIGRRLAHLSQETGRLLGVASVIGREFRFETLEAVGELRGDELLEALEEAVDAGILQEVAGEVGRYGFTHAIIRETLYDEIATTRRLSLHREIGAALERFHSDSLESHLPELAYHYLEAAHAGDVDKAVDYAARAGRRSLDLYAYEEAAGHFERALQVLDVRAGNGHQRFDLLMALGDAQWRAGDVQSSKATFRQAARTAREQSDPERLAAAALGLAAGLGGFGVTDRADAALIEILGEALEALPEADGELQVRLLARLAVELYYTDEAHQREELSRAAVEMAARLGDPKLELLALYSRHWSVLGPDDVEGQLAAATEIVRLAGLVGDREMAFRGHHFRLHSLLVLGDHAAVDAEIRSCERLAKELRQPLYSWQVTVFRAMREMHRGRLDEAERLAQEAAQIGQRGEQEITFVTFGAQIAVIRLGQGRLEEILDGGDAFVEQYPHSAWPAAMAGMYAEAGRREEARTLFERLAADGFAGMRRDGNWLASLCCLSLCASFLGDSARAAHLYDLLAPFADYSAALNAGACALPPNHAPLALLAATSGRWEVATRHFERALELMTTRDSGLWRPAVDREYARMLIARGGVANRERALALLADGLDLARAQGMKRSVEQLLELKLEAQGVVAADVRSSIDVVAESVEATRPDLRPAAAPDGTVTMLFSDIEGSTAMTERLGDQRWLELLREHNAIVRHHVRDHGGFEVKSQGDGFMLAFAGAQQAVACAVAIQHAFREYTEEHPDEPLRVRIGLHTGEAIRDQDDFFGRNVILAARIGAIARGGETLVSSLLRELTADTGDFEFDGGRDVELKGLAGTHRVYAVVSSAATEPSSTESATDHVDRAGA